MDNPLVLENVVLLQSARGLIAQLPDDVYDNNDLAPFNSGVGKHMRHILDFYDALINAEKGRVDYDRRARQPKLETSRQAAMDAIDATCNALATIGPIDDDLLSKNDDAGSRTPDSAFCRSTVGRELQFLANHSVHHFAMITMILAQHGIHVPPEFGVAPSTLRHWQTS